MTGKKKGGAEKGRAGKVLSQVLSPIGMQVGGWGVRMVFFLSTPSPE